MAVLLVGTVGCVGSAKTPPCTASQSVLPTSPQAESPTDPLLTLTDPSSAEFDDNIGAAIVHELGQGPATLVANLPENLPSIRFFVTCVPESYFMVTTAGSFFSGYCGETIQNSGEFPLDGTLSADRSLEVILDISPSAQFWLLGVPGIAE